MQSHRVIPPLQGLRKRSRAIIPLIAVLICSCNASDAAVGVDETSDQTRGGSATFNAGGEVVGSDAGGFQHCWIWSPSDGKYDLSANLHGGSYEGLPVA